MSSVVISVVTPTNAKQKREMIGCCMLGQQGVGEFRNVKIADPKPRPWVHARLGQAIAGCARWVGSKLPFSNRLSARCFKCKQSRREFPADLNSIDPCRCEKQKAAKSRMLNWFSTQQRKCWRAETVRAWRRISASDSRSVGSSQQYDPIVSFARCERRCTRRIA